MKVKAIFLPDWQLLDLLLHELLGVVDHVGEVAQARVHHDALPPVGHHLLLAPHRTRP